MLFGTKYTLNGSLGVFAMSEKFQRKVKYGNLFSDLWRKTQRH